jgi:hypothetical protein
MHKYFIAIGLILLWSASVADPDDEVESTDDLLIGAWEIDERTLEGDGVTFKQTGTIHIIEKSPRGEYVVLSTSVMRGISEEGFSVNDHPVCEGKKECTFSNGSEGIAWYSNGVLEIDWSGENWYDDMFTVRGDEMFGEDPNGAIHLVKKVAN